MAVIVVSEAGTSVAANAKTTNIVDGQYEFLGKGKIWATILPSATGMNFSLSVGGQILVDDQEIPFFGTSGGMSMDNLYLSPQAIVGGRVVATFRNTTGGAITYDVKIEAE